MAKQSKADFLRSWGLPYPSFQHHHLRYKNPPEKGVFWYYFSLHVRQRDVAAWGTCISCGRPITVETSQAGHFMPAANCGRDLLFDERNVNAECERCNAWDETHLLGYADGLDRRYGPGTAAELRRRRDAYLAGGPTKDWKAPEYAARCRELSTYPQVVRGVVDTAV
jgi:5-methylcytosine-specific restriction endonuclease McrA